MKRIALTGGIGSGKSIAAQIFRALGAAVYNSDNEAKRLMESDAQLVQAIKNEFGEQIYNDGKLDRKALSEWVFGNKETLQRLNSLVHPAVERDFERWCAEQTSKLAILESAIIFDNNLEWGFDAIITVSAPTELRIKRTMERDNVSEEAVRARIAAQMTDAERESRADYTIINDDYHSLWQQIINTTNAINAVNANNLKSEI